MPLIEIETVIRAPRERVFDLARSIDAHQASTKATGERAVAGITSGLIGPGQQVTWQARHLGIRQHLTVAIVDFDRPRFFSDRMLAGAFATMAHEHRFEERDGATIMRDRFEFRAPLGWLGRMAELLVLTRYLRSFLRTRAEALRVMAESDDWRKFLPDTPGEVRA